MTRVLNSVPQRTDRTLAVCHENDVLPNTGVAALVEGQAIAIFRLDDEQWFAIGNVDPFSQASVLSRGIVGDIDGVPVVASPIYKQHFRLQDGVCVEDDSVSVPSFGVFVDDAGTVTLSLTDPS
ncbi:MAG: nitrite reductase small subunit NirD [Pseudomonadota bacterium]